MKKRMMRAAALLLTVMLMASVLTGCGNSEVKKLIDKFETACVEVDAEGILDCMDPTITKPLRGILDLFGASDINGIVSDIFKAVDFINFEGADPEDVLATIKIKPDAYTFNKDKDECTVTATITYTVKGAEKSSVAVFDCFLKDEVWYIKDISF